MKTNTFEEKLEEIKKQVWDAATLNADNPLGHRLLDAHFAAITDLVLNDVVVGTHEADWREKMCPYCYEDVEGGLTPFKAGWEERGIEQRSIIKGGNHED